jgi:hypothetical protein
MLLYGDMQCSMVPVSVGFAVILPTQTVACCQSAVAVFNMPHTRCHCMRIYSLCAQKKRFVRHHVHAGVVFPQVGHGHHCTVPVSYHDALLYSCGEYSSTVPHVVLSRCALLAGVVASGGAWTTTAQTFALWFTHCKSVCLLLCLLLCAHTRWRTDYNRTDLKHGPFEPHEIEEVQVRAVLTFFETCWCVYKTRRSREGVGLCMARYRSRRHRAGQHVACLCICWQRGIGLHQMGIQ